MAGRPRERNDSKIMNRKWGSYADRRNEIARFDEYTAAIHPAVESIDRYLGKTNKDVRDRARLERYIEHVHQQFAQVVDPFILKHTNSVICKRSENVPGQYDLTVYLDDSTCAAELNARRELIRVMYRAQFGVVLDKFDIRISKGNYLKRHPFAEEKSAAPESKQKPLSARDQRAIEDIIAPLEDGPVKDSFRKALTAQKRRKAQN